jgi:hypothetical protein
MRMVSVDTADQTAGYLLSKIKAGPGIIKSVFTEPSGNEQVMIEATAVTEDHKVDTTVADAAPEFLDDKIAVSGSISKVVIDKGGGVQAVQLSVPAIPAPAPNIPTQLLWVDGARVDSYTENGTITYPFKTVQDACAYASGLGVPCCINIAPSTYTPWGSLNIPFKVSLRGSSQGAVIIVGTVYCNTWEYGQISNIQFQASADTQRFYINGSGINDVYFDHCMFFIGVVASGSKPYFNNCQLVPPASPSVGQGCPALDINGGLAMLTDSILRGSTTPAAPAGGIALRVLSGKAIVRGCEIYGYGGSGGEVVVTATGAVLNMSDCDLFVYWPNSGYKAILASGGNTALDPHTINEVRANGDVTLAADFAFINDLQLISSPGPVVPVVSGSNITWADATVQASPTDKVPGQLLGANAKLVAGANITLNLLPGPSEQVEIVAAGGGGVPTICDRLMWVDNSRVDVYVEDGSIIYPYKTLAAAVAAASALGGAVTLRMLPGNYGSLTIPNGISLEGSPQGGTIMSGQVNFNGDAVRRRVDNITFRYVTPATDTVTCDAGSKVHFTDCLFDKISLICSPGSDTTGYSNTWNRPDDYANTPPTAQLTVAGNAVFHQSKIYNRMAPYTGAVGLCVHVSTGARLTMRGAQISGYGGSHAVGIGVVIVDNGIIDMSDFEVEDYNHGPTDLSINILSSPATINDPNRLTDAKLDAPAQCNAFYTHVNGFVFVTAGSTSGNIVGTNLRGFPPRRDVSSICSVVNLSVVNTFNVWEHRQDRRIVLDFFIDGVSVGGNNPEVNLHLPRASGATSVAFPNVAPTIVNDAGVWLATPGLATLDPSSTAMKLWTTWVPGGGAFAAGATIISGSMSFDVDD